MTRAARLLGLLGGSLAAAAWAAPPRHAGLLPGEGSTYRLSVGPIEGARARMSVGPPLDRGGVTLVAVQGEAETISLVNLVAPVTASYKVVLDAATLLPREINSAEKGLRNRSYHSLIDGGRTLDIELISAKKNGRVVRHLSREIRDPISAYFALRASRLHDGDVVEIDVLDGLFIWRSHVRVADHQPLQLGDADHPSSAESPAIHLEGTLVRVDDAGRPVPKVKPRALAAWIADDSSRTLLRAEFDSELGRARLDMTSFQPPAKHVPLAPPHQPLPGLYAADGKRLE